MNDPTSIPDPSDGDIAVMLDVGGHLPSESFRATLAAELHALADGDDVAVLRSSSTRSTRRHWGALAFAAAAAVVLIVAITVVGRNDANELVPVTVPTTDDGDAAVVPIPVPDPEALAGDELFKALTDRSWIALERFDVPSTSALTSVVTFSGSVDSPELNGHDGCNGYTGSTSFDGRTVLTDGFESEGEVCDINELTIAADHQIELLAGATTFMLRASHGGAIARFTDYNSLELAIPDDLNLNTVVDGLQRVEFTSTGRVSLTCAQFAWAVQDDRIVVTLDDPDQPGCAVLTDVNGAEIDETVLDAMRELTLDGAEVRRTDDGLLLVADRGAIHLRTLPQFEADPNGVSIAAGAIYGIEPGIGVTPESVLIAVTPKLGDPDLDTGWIPDANDGQMATCELTDYRELTWGDLVFGFWGTGSRTELLFWRVGDERIILNFVPEIERPDPDLDPTGLPTDAGVGIGDAGDAIADGLNVTRIPWGDLGGAFETNDVTRVDVASPDPDFTVGGRATPFRGGTYLVVDGSIVAFGAEDYDC